MSGCEMCGKTVEGAFVDAGQHGKYHKECFKCSGCESPINGGFKKSPTGLLTCAACASKGGDRPQCYRCKQTIGYGAGEEYKQIRDKVYFHNRCATCKDCGVTPDKVFWQRDEIRCDRHTYV